MNIKILRQGKNDLELEIEDRYTLGELIVSELLKNEKVDFAAYKVDSLESETTRLYVKTKKEDPKKVLKETIDKIISNLEEEMKENGIKNQKNTKESAANTQNTQKEDKKESAEKDKKSKKKGK